MKHGRSQAKQCKELIHRKMPKNVSGKREDQHATHDDQLPIRIIWPMIIIDDDDDDGLMLFSYF